MLGIEARVVGDGVSMASGGLTEQGGSVAEATDGEGAPVRVGRGEAVGELCEGEAVLARGSERAEERR